MVEVNYVTSKIKWFGYVQHGERHLDMLNFDTIINDFASRNDPEEFLCE